LTAKEILRSIWATHFKITHLYQMRTLPGISEQPESWQDDYTSRRAGGFVPVIPDRKTLATELEETLDEMERRNQGGFTLDVVQSWNPRLKHNIIPRATENLRQTSRSRPSDQDSSAFAQILAETETPIHRTAP